MNDAPTYNTNSLPWPLPIPVNYGYDMEAVTEFAKYKRQHSEFVNITFPNGKTLTSWDFDDGGAYAYVKLFNERKDLWQANQRASAKKMSLEEILFDATDNSIEAVYDVLHNYCVQGKSVSVDWEGKTIYSIDCSCITKDKNLMEIKNTSPERYAKDHPNFNTFGATFVSSMGLTIDEAVDRMIRANKAGLNVYTRIQSGIIPSGRIYSSWATSVDAVYLQGFGETKLKYDMALQQRQENLFIGYNESDKERMMKYWLEHAKEMLISDKELSEQFYDDGLPYIEPLFDEGEWKEWVERLVLDGELEALEYSIDIMKCLFENDFEKAKELFDSAAYKSFATSEGVMSTLRGFCPKGFDALVNEKDVVIDEELERD